MSRAHNPSLPVEALPASEVPIPIDEGVDLGTIVPDVLGVSQPVDDVSELQASRLGSFTNAVTHRQETTKIRDPVKAYLDEIGTVPLLTKEDEVMLATVIKNGHEYRELMESGKPLDATERKAAMAAIAAKERFIRANLRLVVRVARIFPVPRGMELLDVIQEGNVGLDYAVKTFDPAKGERFAEHAWDIIQQAISRSLDRTSRTIRLPYKLAGQVRKAGLNLGDPRTAGLLEISNVGSLDDRIRKDTTVGDNLHSDEFEERVLARALIHDLLYVLPEDQRSAFWLKHRMDEGESSGRVPRTDAEVGELMGLTGERARQLNKVAIHTMKTAGEQMGLSADNI